MTMIEAMDDILLMLGNGPMKEEEILEKLKRDHGIKEDMGLKLLERLRGFERVYKNNECWRLRR